MQVVQRESNCLFSYEHFRFLGHASLALAQKQQSPISFAIHGQQPRLCHPHDIHNNSILCMQAVQCESNYLFSYEHFLFLGHASLALAHKQQTSISSAIRGQQPKP